MAISCIACIQLVAAPAMAMQACSLWGGKLPHTGPAPAAPGSCMCCMVTCRAVMCCMTIRMVMCCSSTLTRRSSTRPSLSSAAHPAESARGHFMRAGPAMHVADGRSLQRVAPVPIGLPRRRRPCAQLAYQIEVARHSVDGSDTCIEHPTSQVRAQAHGHRRHGCALVSSSFAALREGQDKAERLSRAREA
jgi:hypothetical protein